MGQVNFKKPFEIQTFNELFQCGMTRLRITNLGVFIQYKYTGTNLRNKIMGKSLSQKYLKFPSKKSKNKVLLGNIKTQNLF